MVFFVCEGCNETLKKNQVDKHCFTCRRCEAVTCVDCQVTFYGDDYKAHIVCVSEAEKYEKSLYKGKKEKANPQETWMELIQSCAAEKKGSQNVQRILGILADIGNVPRNKNKFGNFVKNSLKIYANNQIEEVWTFLENSRPPKVAEVAPVSKHAVTAEPEEHTAVNIEKKKKRKLEDIEEETVELDSSEASGKKSSKDKKKKSRVESELEQDGDENDGVVEGDESKKKKKKKKKRNRSGDVENGSEQGALAEVAVELSEAVEDKIKKKKKKDKRDQ